MMHSAEISVLCIFLLAFFQFLSYYIIWIFYLFY